MNSILEGGEHLERELAPEPIAPRRRDRLCCTAGWRRSCCSAWVAGRLFHHNLWGGAGRGGAIQVNLVSSALPLPADQPPNQNVLATETPSQAPAAPSPKEQQRVDETAIPILGKQVKPQAAEHAQDAAAPARSRSRTWRSTASRRARRCARHQSQAGSNGPTTVGDGDFAQPFRLVRGPDQPQDGHQLVPAGGGPAHAQGRAGLSDLHHSPGRKPVSDLQVDRSSGSPTLDTSCMRGVQRVDTFGALPPAYNPSTLKVSYYCEY